MKLVNYETSKRGVLQLLNPATYLFLILIILILITITFWSNTINNSQEDKLSTETIAIYSNDISQLIHTYELPLNHPIMNQIEEDCQGLNISNYEESFFLEKHCHDKNVFYSKLRRLMIDNLKQDIEQENFNQRYIEYIRELRGARCRLFSEIISQGNDYISARVQRNFEIFNAQFVLPKKIGNFGYKSSLYSVCSEPSSTSAGPT